MGAAESGKSTICRHIRQLHGEQFNDAEIVHFKHNIRKSCLEHFISITSDFLQDETPSHSHEQQFVQFLEEYKKKSEVDRQFLEEAVTIWRIASFQKYILAMTTTKECEISRGRVLKKLHSDNPGNHFLRHFDRIMSEGYCPKLEDILSLRIPTTGVTII